MVRVRFYYDVYVDEDDILDPEFKNEKEITDEDIISRARTLFAYDIQDRDVRVNELEWEILE